jgi:hypothetical protein
MMEWSNCCKMRSTLLFSFCFSFDQPWCAAKPGEEFKEIAPASLLAVKLQAQMQGKPPAVLMPAASSPESFFRLS